jgi:D-sedoheptulose 7-phosphate isomerase
MSITNSYFENLRGAIDRCENDRWDEAIDLIDQAWQDDRQVIVFGNGGSALAAQHAITDWNKNLYLAAGKPFRGTSLADNMGIFSAYANDVCYEDVFLEQLRPLLGIGDLVLAISGSGNSENVVRAVQYAKSLGARVICLTGHDGGRLAPLGDCSVHIPIHDMQIAEDLHLVFIHVVLRELMSRGKARKTASE